MQNTIGFLILNIYALLVIGTVSVVFFSKPRLKQVEDETYKKFLIVNIFMTISGLILGVAVSSDNIFNELFAMILNKFYLIMLILWIITLTFYIFYISLKDKSKGVKLSKAFDIMTLICIFLVIVLPLKVSFTENGSFSTGLAIMFAYLVFGIGFIAQIICILVHRNLKNKKNIPLYLLVFIGSIVLIAQMINPNLNYIINPALVFVVVVMFHTIENPDSQIIDILLRNKELVESSVNDRSNFLFKVSQEMKKPIKSIIDNSKLYKDCKDDSEKDKLVDQILQDANNAYFQINDISSISSTDVKKIKMYDNKYSTKKLFADIRANVNNKVSLSKKDIVFSFKTFNKCPDNLCGDNIKLKQVILSVVSNSIKYTTKGFIDIEVDSIIRYDVARLVFAIKDSGCGMSITKINEILSSNVDIDNDEFVNNDSLGLSLPVAIKVLKILGGSISIKSEEGKGTIVVIVVDQKVADREEEKILEDARKHHLSVNLKQRIFIADDVKDLDKMSRIISNIKSDADVISSLIGRDCIDKISSGDRFDLIILKDDMEPDSAYSIFKELRKFKKFTTPVVVMINKDKEFIKEHFINDGFSDVIVIESFDNDIKRVCDKYL